MTSCFGHFSNGRDIWNISYITHSYDLKNNLRIIYSDSPSSNYLPTCNRILGNKHPSVVYDWYNREKFVLHNSWMGPRTGDGKTPVFAMTTLLHGNAFNIQ